MELPDYILDVAKSDISDADLGALIRGALGLTEAPKHLQLGALIMSADLKRKAEARERAKATAEEKKQRNREYMREYMRRKRREKGAETSVKAVSKGEGGKPLKQVLEATRAAFFAQNPQPPPKAPPPEPPPQATPPPAQYYASGHVSSASNAVAYRQTSTEQRAFIKAFCKRPKDYVLFNEAYAEAIKEVKPDVLEECARLAVEYQRKTDGDSQKLRRPENWLADRAWMDFVAQAKRTVKERRALSNGQSSLDFLDKINPNEIGVFEDGEEIS